MKKLRNQNGVTVVFALVIFLVMALFSFVMVNASLSAARSVYASRTDERAYASVRAAATLLQKSLKASPEMRFALGVWTDEGADNVVQTVYLGVLNDGGPRTFAWSVQSDDESVQDSFPDVRFTVTVEYLGDAPAFTFRFQSAYKMTMVIRGHIPDDSPDTVRFTDNNGHLDMETSLGA